jgi:hypothetical protein
MLAWGTGARVLLTEGSSLTSREVVTCLGPAGDHLEVLDPDPLCLVRFSRWVRKVGATSRQTLKMRHKPDTQEPNTRLALGHRPPSFLLAQDRDFGQGTGSDERSRDLPPRRRRRLDHTPVRVARDSTRVASI